MSYADQFASPANYGTASRTPSPYQRDLPARPRVVLVDERASGGNNGFAIAVLVISIVTIVVCILIVFLVKPCPNRGRKTVELVVAAGGAATTTPVPDLASMADLESVVAGDSVVMFYAPWCGHCVQTKPEFIKAASDMRAAGPQVAMVNGDVLKEALTKYDIKGYPTIRRFHKGQSTEYAGNRTAQSLVDFAKTPSVQGGAVRTSDKVVSPSTAAELDALVATGNAIVMFHAPWCSHCKTTKPEFEKAAAAVAAAAPGIRIVGADGDKLKDALKKYDIRGFPTIKLFRKGQTFEYSGNRLAASFVDFVKSHM